MAKRYGELPLHRDGDEIQSQTMNQRGKFVIYLIGLWMMAHMPCRAQIFTNAPERFIQATSLSLMTFAQLSRAQDQGKIICAELLDAHLLHLIAKNAGLTDADLATVAIARSPYGDWIEFYQVKPPARAFEVLRQKLSEYAEARGEGHTRSFLLAGITNRINLATIKDSDLKILATNQPLIPITLVHREDSGTWTNKAGEITSIETITKTVKGREQTITITNIPQHNEIWRWTRFYVTDGDITWVYQLQFDGHGKMKFFEQSKCDAKEYDPRFK